MGYDMTWEQKDPEEEKAVVAARVAWDEAVKARDALPKESAGVFIGLEEADAQGLTWEDHQAWEGRTPEFIAAEDAVMTASDAEMAAETSYFRINIFRMGGFRNAMELLNMGFWIRDVDRPTWPDHEHYGIDSEMYYAISNESDPYYDDVRSLMTEQQRANATRCAEAVEAHRAWHAPESLDEEFTGIPLHKLSSNDSWLVTPRECQQAIDALWSNDEARVVYVLTICGFNESSREYWNKWVDYIKGAITHGGFRVN